MKWCAGGLAGLALAVSASVANAYVIDFTDSSTGTTGSLFQGAVSWQLTSSGTLNNSQSYDGNSTPSGTGLSFETDGYGVGAHDDEITNAPMRQEWIQITFSAPVLIDAIYFLDLFVAPDRSSVEVGQASVNGGNPLLTLTATDIAGSGAPGFVGSTFAPIYASVIRFTVLSSNDSFGYADGALAGVGIAPIPVPAAGVMLLGGLGGLAALRRRRRKAN
ncbi:MAG: VPLPA-CTERM sorting domain-containing protein [Rhodobacteraceae bacterium]|nr:VPLPA-CTERM sorting domain-containing protein [Paracoccaceae bacterium]